MSCVDRRLNKVCLNLNTWPSHLRLGDDDTGDIGEGEGRVKEEPASENPGEVSAVLFFLSFDRSFSAGSTMCTRLVPSSGFRPLLLFKDNLFMMFLGPSTALYSSPTIAFSFSQELTSTLGRCGFRRTLSGRVPFRGPREKGFLDDWIIAGLISRGVGGGA
jgi:hypothetical protein